MSGEKDNLPYVPVDYTEANGRKTFSLEQLANALSKGNKLILLGNYGTGKSRCIQETYLQLCNITRSKRIFPLAIDLREHWGLRRGPEIIRRHFEDLGLSQMADAALKVIDKGLITLLLDGFDEIASQVWSDDPVRLGEIRKQSLAGVYDLINMANGGILIAGREHYFNSDDEMFQCLGMNSSSTLVLKSADEFSSEQMKIYLRAFKSSSSIPDWLPRRPLISKMLTSFDDVDLAALLEDYGEIEFWHRLLDAICKREARIPSVTRPINDKECFVGASSPVQDES